MDKSAFLLDPTVTFLNHGSYGACPRVVFDRYQYWQRALESNPVDFISRRLDELMAGARQVLADYLGASADNLSFVANATTGVNIALRAIGLQPDDEILTTDLEYGACIFALQRHAQVVEVDLEHLFEHVTERTRVLFISHITSKTGLVLPIEPIVARARELGLITIVDGAHAPAHIDLDLDALDADFYTGNCHKWMCAPKGAAFLHVSPRWQGRTDGAIISWGDFPPATFRSRTEIQGTRDSAAYLTVPDAIAFVQEHSERERCVALTREARRELCALLGTEPIAPDDMIAQMATVLLPTPDLELQERLFHNHRVEVNGSRDGTLFRISIASYNTHDDVDRLISALRQEVRR